MSMSGVELSLDALAAYNEMQQKGNQKRRCLVFHISAETKKVELCLELCNFEKSKEKTQEEEYNGIIECLPKDKAFFIAWDLAVSAKSSKDAVAKGEGQTQTKNNIMLMSWIPEHAKVKDKMVYASTFMTVKRKFTGVHLAVEVHDSDECSYDAILKKMEK